MKRAGSILGMTLLALAISAGAGASTALAGTGTGQLRPQELSECYVGGVGQESGRAICYRGYGSVRVVTTCDDWAWFTYDVYGPWVGPGIVSSATCSGGDDILGVRYETKS